MKEPSEGIPGACFGFANLLSLNYDLERCSRSFTFFLRFAMKATRGRARKNVKFHILLSLNHDLFTVADVDALGGRGTAETVALKVMPIVI